MAAEFAAAGGRGSYTVAPVVEQALPPDLTPGVGVVEAPAVVDDGAVGVDEVVSVYLPGGPLAEHGEERADSARL